MYLYVDTWVVSEKGLEIRMKAREGDLIESVDGNIFDVKGLVHPPDRIIAFIRFTPDPNGERKRNSVRYKKVYRLHERYALLRQKFPQYLKFDPVFNEWLCEVPTEMVKKQFEPSSFLSQLRSKNAPGQLESQSLQFVRLLQQRSKVDWEAFGISGSLLVGLHTATSDIDLIVYGSRNARKVHDSLKPLMDDETNHLKSYGIQDLRTLFDFRSKDTITGFEDFVRTESRKVLQGKFHDHDYFIRCVRDWNEVNERYGDVRYEAVGESKIVATISNDSQMIFTPCIYKIKNVEVLQGVKTMGFREIVSFRGRFCEQARLGEKVVARGKVECVRKTNDKAYLRLLIGNKASDFMYLC